MVGQGIRGPLPLCFFLGEEGFSTAGIVTRSESFGGGGQGGQGVRYEIVNQAKSATLKIAHSSAPVNIVIVINMYFFIFLKIKNSYCREIALHVCDEILSFVND
ncbi:MAG: hypothetical protein NTW98_01380 [Candidatus Nomurabacteria bacterium]|nr:hypothetical protein [Candidatus Nomurabacteria bacterium]